jgi:hypothetical protein
VAPVRIALKNERRKAQRLATVSEREQPQLQLLAKALGCGEIRESSKEPDDEYCATHHTFRG